jgi:hypothetical protein
MEKVTIIGLRKFQYDVKDKNTKQPTGVKKELVSLAYIEQYRENERNGYPQLGFYAKDSFIDESVLIEIANTKIVVKDDEGKDVQVTVPDWDKLQKILVGLTTNIYFNSFGSPAKIEIQGGTYLFKKV